MNEKMPQTRANHVRFDPIFHFFLIPVAFITFVWSVVHLVRHTSTESGLLAVMALLLLLAIFLIRVYSLKVQNRVIRLEERLRLASLLGDARRPLINKLSEGQLVALRFCSDTELPALAEKAAAHTLGSKQIKSEIKTWRPDYYRV